MMGYTGMWHRTRSTLTTCSGFVLALVMLTLFMRRAVSSYDEALILVGAERVMDGAVPYRDFYANYGPASFYALAGLFKLFGSSVLVERAFDLTLRGAIIVVAYHLVRLAAPRVVAWVTAALITAWLGDIGSYSYPVWPCLLTALVTVLFVARSRGSPQAWAWFLAAGASAGVTALFRFDVGFYVMVVLCLSAVMVAPRMSRTLANRLAPILAGIALVCCPVALALALAGAVPDLLFDNITFPARTYAAMRSLPFPRPREVLSHPQQIAIYLPVLIVPLGILALLFSQRDPTRRDARHVMARWLVGLLAAMSAIFYLKGIVRVSVLHMALSFIPSLCVAAIAIRLLPRSRWARGGAALLGILVAAGTLVTLVHDARTLRENVAWALKPATWSDAAAPSSCSPTVALARLRCFEVDPTWEKVVVEIDRLSSESKMVFVGLPRHDHVVINDMLLYFAAQRRPATKWYHFDPGLQTSREIQVEMIADLRMAWPPVIVLYDPWPEAAEPNGSATSSGVTDFDDYIAKRFETAEVIGPYRILIPMLSATADKQG